MSWLSRKVLNLSDPFGIERKIPGSPAALNVAIDYGKWGKPYGKDRSFGDIAGGGTVLSQNPRYRDIGRAIGTAFAIYGGYSAMGAGGATGGAAAGTAAGGASAGTAAGGGTVAAGAGAGASSALATAKTLATLITPIASLISAASAASTAKSARESLGAGPQVSPPVTMPIFGSQDNLDAMRASIREQLVRRGRASTILTSEAATGDRLGG